MAYCAYKDVKKDVQLHAFLSLEMGGEEPLATWPNHFLAVTVSDGRWKWSRVSPSVELFVVKKGKYIPLPAMDYQFQSL